MRKDGKKPHSNDPEPPTAGPWDKDQVNLTNPESRIMPVSGSGLEQSCNAHAIDTDSMLVVSLHVTQATNPRLVH